MSDSLRPGWISCSFSALCQQIVNGGTPDTGNPSYWNGTTPWITGADFTERGIGEFRRYVSGAGIRGSATSVVRQGNLLVVTRTGVGKIAIAPCDIAISQDVTGIYLDADKVDINFAYYLLKRELDELKKLNQGTSINGIVRSDLEHHRVQIPESKITQAKIARVLLRIDSAIEKTEALIEKYQQIKAGLMHDLFTRGVLPDGKLRPTRERVPELYRETGIGFLPKEWTVEKLENLLAPVAHNMRSGPFGSALLKHELVENGIPFLGIDNVHVERFVPDFKRFVSRRKFEQLAKYKVRPGDVVITIMGTVGRCCVIPSTLVEALSSKHLWTMTFDEEKVIPELVCWQLNHAAWAQAWFRRAMQGGIMDAIQSKTLKTLMLPLPSPEEQKLIHGRYGVISRRISTAVEQLDKLRLEKNGLMHDLLTGKVAVKVDATEEEHA